MSDTPPTEPDDGYDTPPTEPDDETPVLDYVPVEKKRRFVANYITDSTESEEDDKIMTQPIERIIQRFKLDKIRHDIDNGHLEEAKEALLNISLPNVALLYTRTGSHRYDPIIRKKILSIVSDDDFVTLRNKNAHFSTIHWTRERYANRWAIILPYYKAPKVKRFKVTLRVPPPSSGACKRSRSSRYRLGSPRSGSRTCGW